MRNTDFALINPLKNPLALGVHHGLRRHACSLTIIRRDDLCVVRFRGNRECGNWRIPQRLKPLLGFVNLR